MIDKYVFSSAGGREYNEDAYGSDCSETKGVFVVADGLGGHQRGEVASKCVVDSILREWNACERPDAQWLGECIAKTNAELLAKQEAMRCIMKSTVVALAMHDGKAVWANTGDSRLYYIHDGKLAWITEDHSVAFKKYKVGEITRSEIRTDEDQSRLLRAIGNEERWMPDIHECGQELVPGDAFFLCSDGVWEYLDDEEILIDYLKSDSAEKWGHLLQLRMIDRFAPGNDNLTMMTVILQ